jgi:hypothetical protein
MVCKCRYNPNNFMRRKAKKGIEEGSNLIFQKKKRKDTNSV